MNANVKIYKTDGSSNDFFPIKLIITHNRKRKRKIISYSRIEDWDEQNQVPRTSHDDFEDLYSRILEIRSLSRSLKFLQLENVDSGMEFFDSKFEKKLDFYSFADQQIEIMRSLGRSGNADAYQCAIDQLVKFAPALEFEQITMHFLEQFKQLKRGEGLKNTSIRTYLYEIRAIYNKAVRLGVCQDQRPFAGLFLDLQVRKRRHKNEYLDAPGMKKLASINGVSREQQLAVDLSMLQFYFCGCDLIDVYYLKWEQIVKNRVYLQRAKLGAKAYDFDVLITPDAMRIIEKYATKTDEWVFPWRKGETAYKTFRSTHNAKLKRVQHNADIQLAPMGGSLTSKVIRHSFATLAKFAAVDADVIRELMGHERNDIDTIYKDKYPENTRNIAQIQIIGCIFGEQNNQ